jgi:hypothetical protein
MIVILIRIFNGKNLHIINEATLMLFFVTTNYNFYIIYSLAVNVKH